jgi:hypothetical protein
MARYGLEPFRAIFLLPAGFDWLRARFSKAQHEQRIARHDDRRGDGSRTK